MDVEINALGQTVGSVVVGWQPRPVPTRSSLMGWLKGRCCRIEPLDADSHAIGLFEADALDTGGASWTYLPYGPSPALPSYRTWVENACAGTDPLFLAVLDTTADPERPVGVGSFLRIQPRPVRSRWDTCTTRHCCSAAPLRPKPSTC